MSEKKVNIDMRLHSIGIRVIRRIRMSEKKVMRIHSNAIGVIRRTSM